MYDGQGGDVGDDGSMLPLQDITGSFSDVDMHHQIASQAAVLALAISPL